MSTSHNKKVGLCVLCGENRPVTREHVPPKNLFLPPRPKNTITVPVCDKCNHSYHLDDEYFRIYVTVGAEPGTRLERLWKEKVVNSSFERSPRLKGRLNDDRAMLPAHHEREPLCQNDGEVVPDELLPLIQPFDALRIEAVVEKIVRCLHFSLTGRRLPSAIILAIEEAYLSKSEEEKLYSNPTGCVGYNDEFVFLHEHINDEAYLWRLGFYRHRSFTVYGSDQ